jgi:hypothetical protein
MNFLPAARIPAAGVSPAGKSVALQRDGVNSIAGMGLHNQSKVGDASNSNDGRQSTRGPAKAGTTNGVNACASAFVVPPSGGRRAIIGIGGVTPSCISFARVVARALRRAGLPAYGVQHPNIMHNRGCERPFL